jgi:hypothetical protein
MFEAVFDRAKALIAGRAASDQLDDVAGEMVADGGDLVVLPVQTQRTVPVGSGSASMAGRPSAPGPSASRPDWSCG